MTELAATLAGFLGGLLAIAAADHWRTRAAMREHEAALARRRERRAALKQADRERNGL